ncbi:MAG: FAD-dependent oxidoreductase [Alphaproteobacteria bacterium]|nr:MAG: FAD-dependent oxidoreductase [Alphaproteobacteria bacterium]
MTEETVPRPDRPTPLHRVDVAVVGGGLVGLTVAIGLAEAGLEVAVIDRAAPADQTLPAFDGRASAIAHASVRLLETLGIWRHVADHQPIEQIRVSDGNSRLHLHFDAAELGDGPLGEMVENRHLRLALFRRAAEIKTLHLFAPVDLCAIEHAPGRVTLRLADGSTIAAALLIGADGRASRVRRQAGIRHFGWSYGQQGIVATIRHELPHGGIAHERFLPSGPFAILPLTDHRSSLVWTVRDREADAAFGLPAALFEEAIRRRVGGFLGRIAVEGRRWRYPLGLQLAERYVAPRTALVGDAAHGVHPIAGQGLNLGLRDAAALIEVLVEAARLGEDPGDELVLARYQQWRRFDNVLLACVTDGLNRLFSNDITPIRIARDLGMEVTGRIGPARRFLMRHARGTVGRLPRLLQGLPV